MAQADNSHVPESLRLNSSTQHGNEDVPVGTRSHEIPMGLSRPPYKSFGTSQDTLRATATPPVDIPAPSESPAVLSDSEGPTSYIDQYMQDRHPSVSFNTEIKLDSGHRQSMEEPLEKPPKPRERGRTLLQAMAEAQQSSRAHSESEGRTRYDPLTGRHLPKYSSSPPREQARVGERRFPLLQTTVDALARESEPNLRDTMSMLTSPTVSPDEQAVTPQDEGKYSFSPNVALPNAHFTGQAFSYEEPKPFRRTASQRWRDGESSASPQDFFARAGSLRNKSMRELGGRSSRRDTSGSITRSPRSAASSYLRAFSMSSGTNGEAVEAGPLACDAEGQTIGDDYVLGKQIGYGGSSTIKQVTQLQEGRQRILAVKIVRRQIDGKSEAENEEAQAEFEHEVELWRFLNHPNILPLEAVYKLDDATFCFIPLNVGGTLFDLVRANRQGVPHELAKSYSFHLAAALRYLHLDARVVHRDVKLENCLIEPGSDGGPGLLRLCDFGMAEWLSTDSISGPPSPEFNNVDRPPRKPYGPADTSTSAFAGGSLEYAAPEILKVANRIKDPGNAERAIVSPAVDIWAYGVCVYSMVVGSRPFHNAFQPRVVMAILAGDWNRALLAEKGGGDVEQLVSGCLDMDEGQRWDISRVIDCAWLEDYASLDDSQPGINGWRL
ncbi:CAMK protein kinase [Cladophialophora yegresii CBS 114405]|uniref:CAMK protein kinase n=1 Tax=Cladophialophora yegresii CBS 114405 TaxID=1182544 RepID=W9VU10_9EURO|nr:CAMK protein kinase [Cladophialophora yegresii CBS 114405]EXJ55661.1 CAMK protein kinase [Cladophialophora yegresii CBS 114405]